MKYPNLNATVPAGEHFDESAMNEGMWLTVSHVNNLEAALAATDVSAVALTEAQNTIDELNGTITAMDAVATANAAAVETLSARIVELEAENATLGKNPSGTGTVLNVAADDVTDDAPVPSYLDENNPINQYADKYARAKK